MIDFFSENFGIRLVEKKQFGGADGAVLDLDGITINLRVAKEDEKMMETTDEIPYGYHHLGIAVDDVNAAYKDLTQKGYTFTAPPKETPNATVAFFQGPDNITIELMQMKS
jgi:catechol 2,3-dioxygenase-like lactoylglutathione lyase family enzyme